LCGAIAFMISSLYSFLNIFYCMGTEWWFTCDKCTLNPKL
jgi:hypothetical protein